MQKILKQNFYKHDTLTVAKDLLGKFVVRKIGGKKMVGKIVEVEAYCGPRDLASHASRGKTERTKIMFGHPGFAYVYMIYGMYYCFNIVTESHGYPAAVLIRAVESVNDRNHRENRRNVINHIPATNGPGKFCKAFRIDKKMNGVDICRNRARPVPPLWIEDRGMKIKKADIVAAKRIGVEYAKEYKDKLWRFYIKRNEWVSKK